MSDAFARGRQRRKEWWDDHLWLQMVTVAVLCIAVGLAEGMNVAVLLVGTAVFLAVVQTSGPWLRRRAAGHLVAGG